MTPELRATLVRICELGYKFQDAVERELNSHHTLQEYHTDAQRLRSTARRREAAEQLCTGLEDLRIKDDLRACVCHHSLRRHKDLTGGQCMEPGCECPMFVALEA
jgi:hypothetical protein